MCQTLTPRKLDPPTHSCQFDTNCGKIRYVSDPIMIHFALPKNIKVPLNINEKQPPFEKVTEKCVINL